MINMKTKSCVIHAEDGDAFWQPGVKGNCITIKTSPWNIEKTQHTVFLHEMPCGGEVAKHAHEENEEIFICLEGKGIITIDEKEFSFEKHDVAFIAPHSMHSIRNISDDTLKFMVVISPTGLEERLKLMGKHKTNKYEAPPEAFNSIIGKKSSHGVI